VIDDSGLSRINTTFFVDEGELLVADENSTNGTFLNGERVEGRPRIVKDGDRLRIGSYTEIRVALGTAPVKHQQPVHTATPESAPSAGPTASKPKTTP